MIKIESDKTLDIGFVHIESEKEKQIKVMD